MNEVLEAISNGLGSQSMYLLLLAARGEIPATVSITADTGAENDCLWNTGERTSALEYWTRVVVPLCAKHGITPYFTRSLDKYKQELPSLRGSKDSEHGALTSSERDFGCGVGATDRATQIQG